MDDQPTRKFQKELNAGAISLVLLSVLQRQGEPMYGYEIARCLERSDDGELPMNQAAIYPVLRSMERQSLLTSELVASEVGPPRKYYQLTSAGRKSLRQWTEVWQDTKAFVDSHLEKNDGTGSKRTRSSLSRATRTRS